MEFEYHAITDVGRVRSNNEDTVAVDVTHGLAVLADGMGGYNAGEVASAMAVERVTSELGSWLDHPESTVDSGAIRRAMESCVDNVNRAIFEAANTQRAYAGMGTTIVLAVCRQGSVLIGHVGDSRAYLWRRGTLVQLTRDHSLLQEQLDAGLITPEEAQLSGYRSLVTRALGVEDTVLLDTQERELLSGDIILLCSDGLSEMVGDTEIATILGGDETLDIRARRLIDAANANGGHDNVSVVLVQASGVAKKPGIVTKWWKSSL